MNYNAKKIQENVWLQHASREHQGLTRTRCRVFLGPSHPSRTHAHRGSRCPQHRSRGSGSWPCSSHSRPRGFPSCFPTCPFTGASAAGSYSVLGFSFSLENMKYNTIYKRTSSPWGGAQGAWQCSQGYSPAARGWQWTQRWGVSYCRDLYERFGAVTLSMTLAQVLIPLTPEKKSPQHRDRKPQKHLSPASGCTLRSARSAQGSPQIPCLAPC